MGPVRGRIQADLPLASPSVSGRTARSQDEEMRELDSGTEPVRLQSRNPNPVTQSVPRDGGDFELNWSLGFLLHDHGVRCPLGSSGRQMISSSSIAFIGTIGWER